QLGPLPDLNAMLTYLQSHPGSTSVDPGTTHQKSDPNIYGASERVAAGYLMNTADFSRARLQTGVRIENTHASYTGNVVVSNQAGKYLSTTPVSGAKQYTDVLPSAQLRIALDAN